MIVDANRQYDGAISFAGGQDAGKNPVLLQDDQYQFGENVHCRGGPATTRTAFSLRTLNFLNNINYDARGTFNGTINPKIGSQQAFQQGLFQGALFYDPSLNVDSIVAMIGGRLFQCVPQQTTVDITEFSLPTQNRGDIPIAYLVQADRFCVVQDGESGAIIFDGATARRAGLNEVPTGLVMAYGMGRLVVLGKDRRDIFFGDLWGSHDGEPGLSVLQFTEMNNPLTTEIATLPFTMGHAVGMAFIPQQDTTMGQGQLFVLAEKGTASFFLNLPRDQWAFTTFQVMFLIDIGATGHRSITPVNSDIWFRSKDGWRTIRMAHAEARGWSQLPMSTEVTNYVDVETPSLLAWESSINFENRLWSLCTPIWNQGRPYFNGMLSLDFFVLSSFGQAAHKPSWDGHHSGIQATQLVAGNFNAQQRAFAFGLDGSGNNCIYELDPAATRDTSGLITSSIVPKSFTFQTYFDEWVLEGADAWFEDISEQTTVSAYLKPDNYPDWIPWRTGTLYPPANLTPIGLPGQFSNGMPVMREGFSPRWNFYKPDVGTDSANTRRDLKRGFEFSTKIQWTGNAALNRYRIYTQKRIEKKLATPD